MGVFQHGGTVKGCTHPILRGPNKKAKVKRHESKNRLVCYCKKVCSNKRSLGTKWSKVKIRIFITLFSIPSKYPQKITRYCRSDWLLNNLIVRKDKAASDTRNMSACKGSVGNVLISFTFETQYTTVNTVQYCCCGVQHIPSSHL